MGGMMASPLLGPHLPSGASFLLLGRGRGWPRAQLRRRGALHATSNAPPAPSMFENGATPCLDPQLAAREPILTLHGHCAQNPQSFRQPWLSPPHPG